MITYSSSPALNETDLSDVTKEVASVVARNAKSERELFAIIGNAIFYDASLALQPKGSARLLVQDPAVDFLSLPNAISLLSDLKRISHEAAIESGKSFWGQLKKNIKKEIHSNKALKEVPKGASPLKDTVVHLCRVIVASLGLNHLNPLSKAALVAFVSLIMREGYETFGDLLFLDFV
jgi:hypothetical protein